MSESKQRGGNLFDFEDKCSETGQPKLLQASFVFDRDGGSPDEGMLENFGDMSLQHGLSSDCQKQSLTKPKLDKIYQNVTSQDKLTIAKMLKKIAVIFGSTFTMKLVVTLFMQRFKM